MTHNGSSNTRTSADEFRRSCVHTLVGSNLNGLRNLITQINGTYSLVYVSIGGKINENFVQLNNVSSQCRTNSIYQMYPLFLRQRELDEHILVIAIDEFHNQQNREMNQFMLKKSSTYNTDIILFDQYCTAPFLEEFTQYLVEYLAENRILKQNFMICNYVKHLNAPNMRELNSETIIPATIQAWLSAEYSDCFYQWFGYRLHLYNFVYNYNKFGKTHNLHSLAIELEKFIATKKHDTIVVQNKQTMMFWDNIFDITSYATGTSSIALSLNDYYIETQEIICV